jgi:hypothetical protein
MDFYKYGLECSYRFVDEQLWSYAMHMLCADLEVHTLRETSDLWGSDWTGEFTHRLPTSSPWELTDYFTGERRLVNPAIVHAMRSKTLLIREGAAITDASNPAKHQVAHIPV